MRRKCEVLLFCLSSFSQQLEPSFRGGDMNALVQAVATAQLWAQKAAWFVSGPWVKALKSEHVCQCVCIGVMWGKVL